MKRSTIILFFFAFCFHVGAFAQSACTLQGQTPGTAFPVCGTRIFTQTEVKECGDRPVPGPCTLDGVTDKNPYYYKFTCYQSGTLGFELHPNNAADDYDWQLFDITTAEPEDIYHEESLFVACNWSGEKGRTGASQFGVSTVVCGGQGKALFSAMPELIEGHKYLLLISHFSNGQSGYHLSFEGGTAVITDPKHPRLEAAKANCEGLEITVALNKRMLCTSLAADGSDFIISPANASIKAASSVNCINNSFDMDSVLLTLDKPLPPGDYTVAVKLGSDNNTLVDNCEFYVPENDIISLKVLPSQPTPMGTLLPFQCGPASLQLNFTTPVRCSSIAADGSDFIVTGPTPVTVSGASGSCINNKTSNVKIDFNVPITLKGDYVLQLTRGTDGSTLVDDCGQEIVPGAVSFLVRDAVSASFDYTVFPGCTTDSIRLLHNGANDVNQWTWKFDNAETYTGQTLQKIYSTTGVKLVELIVSNGLCSDTSEAAITLPPKVKAAFNAPEIICAVDKASFTDQSTGEIFAWRWDFGNGDFSTQQNPTPVSYATSPRDRNYNVSLRVSSSNGCTNTYTRQVMVVGNCFIAVPSAFTPNNDGLNDYLYPSNAYKADNLLFKVYNRFGQIVFETRDWTHKWDGNLHGIPQNNGAYVWTLSYTNKDTGKQIFLKGSTVLIR